MGVRKIQDAFHRVRPYELVLAIKSHRGVIFDYAWSLRTDFAFSPPPLVVRSFSLRGFGFLPARNLFFPDTSSCNAAPARSRRYVLPMSATQTSRLRVPVLVGSRCVHEAFVSCGTMGFGTHRFAGGAGVSRHLFRSASEDCIACMCLPVGGFVPGAADAVDL